MRTRPLGLGNTTLTAGNDTAGYYGKYQGIYTPNELITAAGITQGTTKNDAYNDPNADITWLKFSHNYKTLFVADRTIHYAISWNHLESLGLVFAKVVEKDGQKYMLRIMQGVNVNPANVAGGLNDEWNSLIVAFTPDTADSHWDINDNINISGGSETQTQETRSNFINATNVRGQTAVGSISYAEKANAFAVYGYRPVLEVL